MMHINWNLINIFLLGLQVKHPGHEIHDPLFKNAIVEIFNID